MRLTQNKFVECNVYQNNKCKMRRLKWKSVTHYVLNCIQNKVIIFSEIGEPLHYTLKILLLLYSVQTLLD